jgi:hypothetical protein
MSRTIGTIFVATILIACNPALVLASRNPLFATWSPGATTFIKAHPFTTVGNCTLTVDNPFVQSGVEAQANAALSCPAGTTVIRYYTQLSSATKKGGTATLSIPSPPNELVKLYEQVTCSGTTATNWEDTAEATVKVNGVEYGSNVNSPIVSLAYS